MNKPLKKLLLKKTTILHLDAAQQVAMQAGLAPTRPLVSCRIVCAVSIQIVCITQSEVC
ncbi:MAG: hypothetical protein JNM68_05260 [Dinghuibacter sp.]|nr:hypothetical protein [Dinghuibacter sp.]